MSFWKEQQVVLRFHIEQVLGEMGHPITPYGHPHPL
jgi:hypothetical protein